MDIKNSSENAIRRYVEFLKTRNISSEHHRASVLISTKNDNFNAVLDIGVMVEENVLRVIISGNNEFCADYKPKYSSDKELFDYKTPGILIIDTEDIWGNTIQINISISLF